MNPYILALIGIFAAFVVGLLLGMVHGAKMGIRIFGKDAIILAFQTLDMNPEKFASMKADALKYPDHEAWIRTALEKAATPKPKPKSVRQEWEEQLKAAHDAGVY